MPAKDWSRWGEVPSNHADDPAYSRHAADDTDTTTHTDIDATDGARKAAAELGVDLAEIEGTGAEGRVTKADVEHAASD